jgi:hypothetical protein
MQPAPQDNQLMSKHRVLSFKPQLRLEWRGQDGQSETEQPDHSASLGDSITSSTRTRFSVHTTVFSWVMGCLHDGRRETFSPATTRHSTPGPPLTLTRLHPVGGGDRGHGCGSSAASGMEARQGENPAKAGFQRSRQPGPRRGDAHMENGLRLLAGPERRCRVRKGHRGVAGLG